MRFNRIKYFISLLGKAIGKILIAIIRFYQIIISPLFPDSCRFYPTCSTYSIQAIQKYGVIKGFFKSVYRILRCHPFSKGGYDPV